MQAEAIGRKDPNDRVLSLVTLPDPSDFCAGDLHASRHFMCFLAWDSSAATVEEISELAEGILQSGAVSISCWGRDCERVHDILSELILGDGFPDSGYSASVMTTWHSRESYQEAL